MSPLALSRAAAIALVFALYTATMCRWIGAGDTAIVVWNMDARILSSHVNNHPAMVAIGSLMLDWMPWGSPAWRANWFSVIFSTIYLGLYHALVSRWLKDPVHALLATLILAVTHAVWWHATIVENYALNGVFVLAVAWMLFKEHETGKIGWMYAAAPVAGLAVFNHAQMGALAPVLGMYALVRDWKPQPKVVLTRWVLLAFGWFVGLLPFLGLMVRNMRAGVQREEVVKNAMGSYFTEIMFDLRFWELGTMFWHEVLVQFPSPVLLALPLGFWFAFRGNERWKVHTALAAGFVINTGFFSLYHTWDRFAFLLPSWILAELWMTEAWAVGLKRADEGGKPWARRVILALAVLAVAMPPVMYREFPRLGRLGWFWPERFASNGQWNTHDVSTYLANPDKSGWNDLAVLNDLLMEKLPKRSTVIDDDGRNHYTLELYYQKVLKQRRDVRATLVNAWGFEGWGQDKKQLADKVMAWRKNAPVFAMSLLPPHRKWQEDLGKQGIGPRPWYLSEDHWIFEFVERPRGAAEPFLWEIHTGLRLKAQHQLLSHRLGPNDDGQFRVRHTEVKAGDHHEIMVTFTGPDGTVLREPLTLSEGERTVAPLPDVVKRTVGTWTVEVGVGDQVDTFLRFRVEPEPVDRRYR